MKRKLFGILIAVLLLTIVFSGCNEEKNVNKIYTPYEVYTTNFNDGDSVTFEGTVSEIGHINTSYGDFKFARISGKEHLVNNDYMNYLIIKINDSFSCNIGDTCQQKLHFKYYTLNNITFLSSEELCISYLLMLSSIKQAIDYSSQKIFGTSLKFNSTENQGKNEYIFNSNNTSFPLHDLKAVLYQISDDYDVNTLTNFKQNLSESNKLFQNMYLFVSGSLGANFKNINLKIIDEISPLSNNSSEKDKIQIVDKNANTQLDDGEIIKINCSPTEDEFALENYLLVISNICNANSTCYKFISNWYNGVYTEI